MRGGAFVGVRACVCQSVWKRERGVGRTAEVSSAQQHRRAARGRPLATTHRERANLVIGDARTVAKTKCSAVVRKPRAHTTYAHTDTHAKTHTHARTRTHTHTHTRTRTRERTRTPAAVLAPACPSALAALRPHAERPAKPPAMSGRGAGGGVGGGGREEHEPCVN